MTASARTSETRSAAHPARVALVTEAVPAGAPSGEPGKTDETDDTARAIGRALALGFARRGWDVALAVDGERERAAADALAAEVRALGRRAAVLVAGLSAEADAVALVPACRAALGVPGCIVVQSRPFADDVRTASYATLAQAMARNVAAPLALARALFDATPDAARSDESRRGVMIHLLDQTLFHPAPEQLSHSLTQAALNRASAALALALAPKVRVASLVRGHAPDADALADAACFLADAPGVTGATLTVDAGEHLAPPDDRI